MRLCSTSLYEGVHFLHYCACLFDFVEHKESAFRVSPGKITEKLIKALVEMLSTFPKLTFRNKDVAPPLPTRIKMSGLSRGIKGLAVGSSYVVTIQLQNNMSANCLLDRLSRATGTPHLGQEFSSG